MYRFSVIAAISLACLVIGNIAKAQYHPEEFVSLSAKYTGCDSVIYQKYDTTKNYWYHSYTAVYKTYQDGHIKLALTYNDTMLISYTKVYFDTKGMLHHYDNYAYIKGTGWVRNTSKYYQYDFLGRLGYEYDSTWNAGSGMQPAYRFNFYHDTLDRLTQHFMYVWSGSAWTPYERWDYYYNALGNDTLERVSGWIAAGSAYLEAARYRYAYDAQNRVIRYEYYMYSGGKEDLRRRQEYTYKGTGRYIRQLISYKGFNTIYPGNQDSIFLDKGGMDYQLSYVNYSNKGIWYPDFRVFCATTALPSAPLNLKATPDGVDVIQSGILTWKDNATDEDGYVIFKSEDSIHWDTLKVMPASATTYNDSAIKQNKTYYYKVYAYNSFGPSRYSNIARIDISSGINDTRYRNRISVYPNPATNRIAFRLDKYSPQRVFITDAVGRIVYTDNSTPRSGNGEYFIPVAELKTGIYFLNIDTGTHHFIEKVLIVR